MAITLRQEVVDYQQHDKQFGGVLLLQPPSASALFWAAIFAAGVIATFLSLAEYSRKATVPGFLAPTSGVVKVFAPRPGTITAVHVGEGEVVRPGQPLITIVNGHTGVDGRGIDDGVLGALRGQRELLAEQISAQPDRELSERERLRARIAGFRQEIVHLEGQVTAQEQRIALLEDLEKTETGLVEKGYVAANEHTRRREPILEQRLSLSALREQVAARRADLDQEHHALRQLPEVGAEKARELRGRLLEVEQRIAQAEGERAYVVNAPVAGTISALQAFVGRTADPQQLQVSLLPERSALQAQLYVPTRAAGFVRIGQQVRLLYDAFPYQRFGPQGGRILQVTRTILTEAEGATPIQLVEPAYKVTVGLDSQTIDVGGDLIPLQADMSLRADIILDRSSLMTWILDPLLGARRRL